jgi:ribosomal protein RSM22 (predicted rRNA methylase)
MTALTPFTPAPLEAAWDEALGRALGRSVHPDALGTMVARQAARYRGEAVALSAADSLAARLRFWFPRDLTKVARPVAELVRARALPPRPLRVLDLGAGLGATSLGLLRALAGRHPVASITAVDVDPAALALLQRVYTEAVGAGLLPGDVALRTQCLDLAAPGAVESLPPNDLVLFGLAGVEVTAHLADESARGDALAALYARALDRAAPDGALLVLEPATRAVSRALHRARQRLLDQGVTVFSPCPHAGPCPMLARDRDWCHEDLDHVALPPWAVPLAVAAGLRWEGPTWSYLVLRRDGITLRGALAETSTLVRAVSRPLESKGKTELALCGDVGDGRTALRAMELHRDARHRDGPRLADLTRGDLLRLAPGPLPEAEKSLRLNPARWTRVDL